MRPKVQIHEYIGNYVNTGTAHEPVFPSDNNDELIPWPSLNLYTFKRSIDKPLLDYLDYNFMFKSIVASVTVTKGAYDHTYLVYEQP